MKLDLGTSADGKPFTLQLEAVTQTFAILAKRGVGKTYTASVMAEEMLAARQQIVANDRGRYRARDFLFGGAA